MGVEKQLQKRRLEMNLSRTQLAEKIHVAPSSIANYENGISYPKPDIMISLIQALKIDANYLFQDYLQNNAIEETYGARLSEDEKISILQYRELPFDSKQLVQTVIHEEYQRMQKNTELSQLPCIVPGIRKLNSGFILQEEKLSIRLPKKRVPKGTDFCFQIRADRYSPIFHKNDILALAHRPAKHNEMGIFSVNKVCYIRSLFQDHEIIRLRALNVMDPDILITEKDTFFCIGTILDKLYGTYTLEHI